MLFICIGLLQLTSMIEWNDTDVNHQQIFFLFKLQISLWNQAYFMYCDFEFDIYFLCISLNFTSLSGCNEIIC
jgi:hypothetical protein